ncbi:SMK killer toxin resistance protein [Emydomyces testavorans]|uniref:SMK killer toxin resistance protein n=1 Tax=Emydomyces testavorans TaxID=2070801 RepID=A0AAF0DGV2_9EURO|nr:SMK killer toxin resistance protein [Emydomyces testavorans]
MASFLTDLWSSVFTPGATPTLLVATNATFAALQVLLLALLYATHSVHFVVLSGLCGALWWAINWFVAEVDAGKGNEAQGKQGSERPAVAGKDASIRPPGAIDTTESETETEGVMGEGGVKLSTMGTTARSGPGTARKPPPLLKRDSTPAASSQMSSQMVADDDQGKLRQRHAPHDSSGYVSTDSEWEKVEEGR